MKKLLIVFLLSSVSLNYAAEMNQVVILNHHSWISEGDEEGHPIEGHIESELDSQKNLNSQKHSDQSTEG